MLHGLNFVILLRLDMNCYTGCFGGLGCFIRERRSFRKFKYPDSLSVIWTYKLKALRPENIFLAGLKQ